MKNIPRHLFVLALSLSLAGAGTLSAQETLQEVYNQAVQDFNAQNYEAAKAGFERILQHKPGYVYARNYLAKTEAAMRRGPGENTGTLEPALAALTVPEIKFENAELGAVMTFLTQKSTELSEGQVTANFIYKGEASDREEKLITLALNNVPLTEVIRYVGLQAGVRFTYDKYAVVGTPLDGGESQEPATETASGATQESLGLDDAQ